MRHVSCTDKSDIDLRPFTGVIALALLLCSAGCGGDRMVPDVEEPAAGPASDAEINPLDFLPAGERQRAKICALGVDDRVQDFWCGADKPVVTEFTELRSALRLAPDTVNGFALLGHSTSLVARSVSAINPRVVLIGTGGDWQDALALAFTRGEAFAEIAARDRSTQTFTFYLVRFRVPCEDHPWGCGAGDLLTQEVERNWTAVDIYSESDLENTSLDCRVCHQPDGPGTPKILRMQEFKGPWTHWIAASILGGRALLDDYVAAKGGESLAGIPPDQIFRSNPLMMEVLVTQSSPDQPNEFLSAQIEYEVQQSAPGQPSDNSVPGQSDGWLAAYERAAKGEAITVPYHDVKVTDAQKLRAMSDAYRAYLEGHLTREALPDIRNVYPDDERLLAEMGFLSEPGAPAERVLTQACGMCHNDRLDQSLSRARFSVNLSRLDRAEKDVAIERLLLPDNDIRAMPPRRFRRLTSEGRDRLITLLRK